MTELTDTERDTLAEAIYARGDEPEWLTTVDGSPNAASFEHADRVAAAVEAILTARLAEAPHVELKSANGMATTCKVWQGGRLLFFGDYTGAALAAPTPTEVQP